MSEHTREASPPGSSTAPVVRASAELPGGPPLPWWSSKVWAATITATLAAILPLATFVQTSVKEAADERARVRQQQDTVRLAYLQKAIDPSHSPTLRLSVLKFLARSSQVDDDIKQWAVEEQPAVQKLVDAEARDEEAQLRSAAAQLNVTQDRVTELQKEKAAPEVIEQQVKRLETQVARIAESEARLRVAKGLATPATLAASACSRAKMRSDLRSGVDERTGTEACQASSKSRRAGETWIERREGRAFECSCAA